MPCLMAVFVWLRPITRCVTMANSLLSAIKGLGVAGSNQPGAAEKHAQILTRRSEVSRGAMPCQAPCQMSTATSQ